MFKQQLRVVSRRWNSSASYNNVIKVIKTDLKSSMLNKRNVEKNTIKLIISTIKDSEIDGAKQDEFSLYKTFQKMIKQRENSVVEYKKQQRDDLAEIEQQELEIINKYLTALPVASKEELIGNLKKFMNNLKEKEGDFEMGKLFRLILKEVAQEWKASPEIIKPLVPQVYRELFNKK